MDNIARGSRRARHVAAHAAAASEADATERRRSRRQQQENADSAVTTPVSAVRNAPAPAPARARARAHAGSGSGSGAAARTPVLQNSAQAAPLLRRQHPHQQPRRRQNQNQNQSFAQGQARDQEQVTPDSLHRTPDRLFGQNASPLAVAAAGVAPHPFRLHRTARYTGTRLSMPYDSDESASEPDVSVLAMARARRTGMDHQTRTMTHDELAAPPERQYDVEDTSVEDFVEGVEDEGDQAEAGEAEDEEREDEEDDDDDDEHEEIMNLVDPADIGLKEISNLGRFTVSSHKPGSGVEELRSEDLKLFWQSDGPQPHKLTVYFVKRVGIRDIRFFVDYNEDESYTPTKIIFKSGTSENNLIEFATMVLENPAGWQQVPIAGTGGEPDGNTLVSYVLQMQILENHQNGKDTHLRGIKIYAFDSDNAQAGAAAGTAADDMADSSVSKDSGASAWNTGDALGDIVRSLAAARLEDGETGYAIPDFMREPEIR
ncbi:hypothetical protein E4U43_004705 [Claviceps pusilla]|uniref:DOC domain-containing protein n=1 Tax=Claviceps pusilla TaxID=123648 RepID=A0A9P7NF38_9HYPO|nr:hypothetical protein E4U43_004705 [Claviceps pusilla]